MPNIKNTPLGNSYRGTHRINLNAKAWRRLRKVYADQSIPAVIDIQNRLSGLWLTGWENMAYGLHKPAAELPEVIFIIGHWRSGTTFLHEMLCLNPDFNFPSTYACMNPHVFPLTEEAMLRRSGSQVALRPMDKMTISLASPQEDEFALMSLGAPSPYEGLLFPKAMARGMVVADPADLPEDAQHDWIGILSKFLDKVVARKPGCPVILKSPTHSYRLNLLRRIYPNARFIHIIRNPFDVYNSTMNMWKKMCALYSLAGLPEKDELQKQVLSNWVRMEEKLDAVIPSLAAESYVRVRYEDLVAQPIKEIEKIYMRLGLKDYAKALPYMEQYVASHATFEKNRFSPTPEEINEVRRAWAYIFEKYEYSMSDLG